MLNRRTNRHYRGDTIIEVVVSFAMFSSVAIVALALMNQGLVSAQKSLEITQVRQQIDSQAEVIRYMHNNYILNLPANKNAPAADSPGAMWKEILDQRQSQASDFSEVNGASECPTVPTTSFVVDPTEVKVSSVRPKSMKDATNPPPFSRLTYNDAGDTLVSADGIWVEAVEGDVVGNSAGAGLGYTDFHIRACWYSPGSSPVMSIGTIVRLYEPAE